MILETNKSECTCFLYMLIIVNCSVTRVPYTSILTSAKDFKTHARCVKFYIKVCSKGNQFMLATSPLRLTTSNFIFQLNICFYNPSVTSSLMRGWVCRLPLLLVLVSAVILRFKSGRAHDHIILSQILDSPNLEDQVPVYTGCFTTLGHNCRR
jgi:hypothetical protein